jgi:hypothetical protein
MIILSSLSWHSALKASHQSNAMSFRYSRLNEVAMFKHIVILNYT